MREKENIRALFEKFVHDQCTAEELKQIKIMLQEGKYEPVWRELIEEDALRSMLEEKNTAVPEVESIFERISQTVNRYQEATDRRINLAQKPASTLVWAKWAAVITLVIIAFGAVYFLRKAPATVAYVQDSTGIGQRKGLRLTDGTEIWLNHTTKIRFPEKFSADKREVFMEGEALFKVAKDPGRPFIVHSGLLSVEVLGTVFNIESFDEERNAKVSVASGKVAVRRQDGKAQDSTSFVLLADQQLIYDKKEDAFTQEEVQIEDVLAWREGMLVFKSQTLEEIARGLERQYGISIEFADSSLMQRKITLKKKGDHLKSILEIIKYAADIQYRYEENNKVVITNRKTDP